MLLTVESPVLPHASWFDFSARFFVPDDNAFDLFPNERRAVRFTLDQPTTLQALRELRHSSLAHSYE